MTYDLGISLSIRNIIALIATMQWLLGPVLGYLYNDTVYMGYRMNLPKEMYFSFILPGSLTYFLGLYLKMHQQTKMYDFKSYPVNYYQKGKFFIVLGFITGLLPIGFLAYILGGLKFVGLFYMFASNNKNKYLWIVPVFGMLIISSLGNGLFHDLILWGSFFMMMYFLFKPAPFFKRIMYVFSGLLIVVMIQFIKGDYRAVIWNNQNITANKAEIFFNIAQNKIFGNEKIFSEENISANVVRINQGWIIAKVMEHVPAYEPYANGATIKDAIAASIFPRFLMPNKVMAGGQGNMEKFAGVTLVNTSMDISQIGEAYANFGFWGGILFMFILGLFFNWVITTIEKKTVKFPDLVFFIPLIFLQAIKAETSLATVLNHVVKTAIVVWFFFSPWGDALINSKFILKKKKSTTLLN